MDSNEKTGLAVTMFAMFSVLMLLVVLIASVRDCSTSRHARDIAVAQEQVKQTQALIKRSEDSDCVLLVVPPIPVPTQRD